MHIHHLYIQVSCCQGSDIHPTSCRNVWEESFIGSKTDETWSNTRCGELMKKYPCAVIVNCWGRWMSTITWNLLLKYHTTEFIPQPRHNTVIKHSVQTECFYSLSHLVVISYLVMQLLCESSWNESLSWICRCSASGPSGPSPASQAARHPASQAASYCGQNRRPGYMMHGIRVFCVAVIYVRAPVLTGLLWKPMVVPFAV